MNRSVFFKDIMPFLLWFVLLILSTIILDFLLHQLRLVWVGRYLGIPGTLLLLLSFVYSLRKRKIIQQGSLKRLLRTHEYLAWFATLLILVHGGIHLNGLLPWLALIFMLLVLNSGLTGKYILKNARQTLQLKYANLLKKGFSEEAVERKVFLDALTIKAMSRWRRIHKPLSMIFGFLTLLHLITVFMFWEWLQ
ncbi:MAG: hypothetical protein HQ517_05505 [SAR324 cluster bacterium]|nr:hypothetical protein [SAR324 cluster bacterium]